MTLLARFPTFRGSSIAIRCLVNLVPWLPTDSWGMGTRAYNKTHANMIIFDVCLLQKELRMCIYYIIISSYHKSSTRLNYSSKESNSFLFHVWAVNGRWSSFLNNLFFYKFHLMFPLCFFACLIALNVEKYLTLNLKLLLQIFSIEQKYELFLFFLLVNYALVCYFNRKTSQALICHIYFKICLNFQ